MYVHMCVPPFGQYVFVNALVSHVEHLKKNLHGSEGDLILDQRNLEIIQKIHRFRLCLQ